jgi:hypothetical protein
LPDSVVSSFGTSSQSTRYTRNPGTIGRIDPTPNATLTQTGLQPRHSAMPPHTPAMIRLCVERRSGPLAGKGGGYDFAFRPVGVKPACAVVR